MILAGARIFSRAFSSKISFEKELVSKINFTGPMSISQYMQEVLTNPAKGYYTTKEKVLGAPGDFVTSPEISQMFGECVAIWIVHEWMKMGSPRPLQLVELGPGHGTLMQDIIKTIHRLSFSSCHRNLIKTFQIEAMIALIKKKPLIFSRDLLNGQK